MADYHFFPDDILICILKRLPPKTLLKLLCISKSWYSLITSPNFISSHFHHQHFHNEKHHDLFYSTFECCIVHYGQPLEHRTRFPIPRNATTGKTYNEVIGSCSGIVLSYNYPFYESISSLCLWNPSIRKCLILEPTPNFYCEYPRFGCGFDSITNDYKVVAISPGYAQIFSHTAWSWKRVELPSFVDYHKVRTRAAFLNGVIYWIMFNGVAEKDYSDDDDSVFDELCNPVVLRFDVHDEVFGELAPPSALASATVFSLTLAVINSSLCMLHDDIYSGNCEYVVWQMKESWKVLYRIDSLKGSESFMDFYGRITDDHDLIIQSSGSLIASNRESLSSTNSVDNIAILEPGQVFSYTESLVLLDKFNEPSWMKKGNPKLDENGEGLIKPL